MAWPNPVIPLSDIHPDSLIRVVTDLHRSEFAFTSGNDIRVNWESKKIQRLMPYSTLKIPEHLTLVACPDLSYLMVNFSTEHQRLSDEVQPAGTKPNKTMSTKKLPQQPAKKLPAKPAAAGKSVAKPVSKAAPVATSKAAPVAAPKAAASKPAKVKPEKPEGNTKWLLLRLKAQAVEVLSDESNRAILRDGLKQVDSYKEAVAFLKRSGISESAISDFLEEFFNHKIMLKPRK